MRQVCWHHPDGHIHRWTVPRNKFIQPTKSLVERLCDFKNFAHSVLEKMDPCPHWTKQPSRMRPMPYNALQQERNNAILTNLLRVGSVCGLGPDILGIHALINLAARYRTACHSGTPANGLAIIQAAREYDHASHFCFQLRMEGKHFESFHGPQHRGGVRNCMLLGSHWQN